MKRTLIALAAAAAVSAPALWHPANAAGPAAAPMAMHDEVFGARIMTQAEIAAYRKELAGAKTAADRARIASRHHDRMVARAKREGVTLPEPAWKPETGGGGGY